jgi:hypothetical protein
MQKFNVPIYIANITLEIKEKTGRVTTVSRKRKINDVIIKGYSIPDMIRRKKETFKKNLNLNAKESIGEIEIELLSQHGYGVDD